MADDEPQFETKTAWTVRGSDKFTKAKWEKHGWEFVAVSQQSLLRTQLTFRRVKTKQPWYLWAGIAGVILVFSALVGVGAALEGDSDIENVADSDAASSARAADASPSRPAPAASPYIPPRGPDPVMAEAVTQSPSVALAEARWLEIMQVDEPIKLINQSGYDTRTPLHAMLPGWGGSTEGHLYIGVQQPLTQVEVLRLGINVLNLIGPEFPDLEGIVFADANGREHNFARSQASGADLDASSPQPPEESPAPVPEPVPAPEPESAPVNVYYKNCTAARDAGAAPVYLGDPGYGKHLDRDGDGIGCEN